jgi:thioredoxin-dependent peroxiredoxin
VQLFAASVDSAETNRRFAENLTIDYPILSDPEKQVARAYGVLRRGLGFAARYTFYIGLDGRILFVDRDVSPGSHGRAVAAKLAELGVQRR